MGPKDQGGAKKKGGGKTVSSFYKSQLEELMKTLMATEPHFIRCVVPNTHKQPGGVEPGLIMHQLTCNGVLEGIRICRKGFPNRMSYPDFKSRYNILAAAAVAKAKSDKAAAASVIDTVGLEKENSDLVIPRFSSEQEFWVKWKKHVRTELPKCCLGFRLIAEASRPG